MSQKALILEKAKSPFVLSSIPIPKPGAIQAHDIILNVKYPTILGLDVAGDVEEVREGVEEYVKGDRVFFSADYSMAHGGLQQYTLKSVSDPDIAKIPPHISYNEAATIPLTFATAVIPLLSVNPIGAGLNPTSDSKVNFNGEAALVIGGGTSVGQFAVQIYKYLGFSTIITYTSLKHSDYLKSLVLRLSPPCVASIMVEGAMEAGYACLAHGGQMATASPAPPKPDDAEATGKKIYGVLASVNIEPNKEFGKELWKNLPRLVKEGIIKPNRIEMLTGLTAVPNALPRFMNGGVSGVKLIVNPQDTV
ncbi:chaperonin 10-like protein [Lentinula aff. detonsa]|uniref:Chaperonin 10-like protein n=1 Tax=Lentinula aff. detonsa TaxID=2804958 RepID=A0AA38NB52_9AGAR|nr:chaperonin 10-like protein [Lentinula aff. detonsa]